MVATHPYIQNPAKNGYFDMAFQLLGYQNGLISQGFSSHSGQRGNFTAKQIWILKGLFTKLDEGDYKSLFYEHQL